MGYLYKRMAAAPGFEALCLLCFICLFPSDCNVPACFGAQPAGPSYFGIPYEVKIEGVPDRKLLVELEAVSDIVSLESRPPAGVNLLRRRAEWDRVNFVKVLKARGYYGAQVKTDIDLKVQPVQVTFHINSGPYYLLKSVVFQVTGEKENPSVKLPEAHDIGLIISEPLRAREILDAQKNLLHFIRQQGFPFPEVIDRQVIVDHKDQSGLVRFSFHTGPRACIGKTVIAGIVSVDEAFLFDLIIWKEGDRYDPDLLLKLQQRLTASGLFSRVRVTPGENLDESGSLPVVIEVSERKHRTISAGINYMTDEGPGAKMSWEHRNFFNQGERLTLTTGLSDFTQDFEGVFREPYFMREDQSLHLLFRIADDTPDAYNSRNIRSSALAERNLDQEKTIGGGLGFKASKVEQIGEEENYRLIFIPLYFKWDTGDDLLDPTQGMRLFLQFVPFYDIMGSDANFIKGYASYRHYVPIMKKPMTTLAGKVGIGVIEGAGLESIPADERFYAGGGGSIRGYAYQYVGPLAEGEPIGGRSLVELSTELRVKLTDHLGLVGFLDGGSAFADTIFGSSQDLRWGTGAGLRYFTPIGPLRLDVAVPLNRRSGIDDSFQIYISLGQAF